MNAKQTPYEVQVKWLDWLSSAGERKALKEKYCTYAGLSENIPDEIRGRLGIEDSPAAYCIIYEA